MLKRIISLVCILVLTLSSCPLALYGQAEAVEERFYGLNDPDLLSYVQADLYQHLVADLNTDRYFVENIEASYLSQEYLEELAFNSQSNIFFGYTLEELASQFHGQRYIFTLGEDQTTIAKPIENAEGPPLEAIIKNVLTGTGLILVCVTVSVVSGGAGAPAVSMIFACSAKAGAVGALSGGILGGVSAGIVKGIQTGDMEEALEAAALSGSEGFKWGAIAGLIGGGLSEAAFLKGAGLNGLTMKEAALIQKESGYPLDVIKQFQNMDQYHIAREAGLTPSIVDNRMALIRPVDTAYLDATGMTNLERMKNGLAPIDPSSCMPYELHHLGQQMNSTLAVLTKREHIQEGNFSIWHSLEDASQIDRASFDLQRKQFWKDMYRLLSPAA